MHECYVLYGKEKNIRIVGKEKRERERERQKCENKKDPLHQQQLQSKPKSKSSITVTERVKREWWTSQRPRETKRTENYLCTFTSVKRVDPQLSNIPTYILHIPIGSRGNTILTGIKLIIYNYSLEPKLLKGVTKERGEWMNLFSTKVSKAKVGDRFTTAGTPIYLSILFQQTIIMFSEKTSRYCVRTWKGYEEKKTRECRICILGKVFSRTKHSHREKKNYLTSLFHSLWRCVCHYKLTMRVLSQLL